MLTFRDLRTQADVAEWTAGLQTRYPERTEVMQHLVGQLKALPFPVPHVVELGPGPGLLAELLLRELPQMYYTGFDSSELLLAYAQNQLAPFGTRARLVHADLNAADWLAHLPAEVHAIISLQAMHDLGDESHINRVYGLAQRLLTSGGLLLNADFVVPPGQDNPDQPGRRSIPRHLELLRAHGFERVDCTLELGQFGCVVGFGPAPAAQTEH
ncbi:MAG: class I SAM-dependent methyltransferase [Anaerolineales bacterium]|nr:class I SAM-dependent methyltransferase [Anaerolineales bacterium]